MNLAKINKCCLWKIAHLQAASEAAAYQGPLPPAHKAVPQQFPRPSNSSTFPNDKWRPRQMTQFKWNTETLGTPRDQISFEIARRRAPPNESANEAVNGTGSQWQCMAVAVLALYGSKWQCMAAAVTGSVWQLQCIALSVSEEARWLYVKN